MYKKTKLKKKKKLYLWMHVITLKTKRVIKIKL